MFRLLSFFYPSLLWHVPVKDKILYLTFDDGPIPEVTPWVLEELKKRNVKATFFCIGDNVRKHPTIFQSIRENGHTTGNHTYHHLNGWDTADKKYSEDIELANKLISSRLFRPPYGKIRISQISALKKKYRIVMWDVLSKDYDTNLNGEQCYQRVIKSALPGSVIVFHDSLKAQDRLRLALPKVMDHFIKMGYTFAALPEN
ncbi:MAG: polysaccharide deacetylase family protein [Bacteroidetes bacterium]|nr:polysaccharide deacetylase family protein [Bacteroidota bacterium]MBL0137613.1 polysaccharide deacetylase family protein [Bacteroidota bacterium]